MSILDLLGGRNQPKKQQKPAPNRSSPIRPNFTFTELTGPVSGGRANWTPLPLKPGYSPVEAPKVLTSNLNQDELNLNIPTPPGWHYGLQGNGHSGWTNPQGQPGILPRYISPGGALPQPAWLDPSRQQRIQAAKIRPRII